MMSLCVGKYQFQQEEHVVLNKSIHLHSCGQCDDRTQGTYAPVLKNGSISMSEHMSSIERKRQTSCT